MLRDVKENSLVALWNQFLTFSNTSFHFGEKKSQLEKNCLWVFPEESGSDATFTILYLTYYCIHSLNHDFLSQTSDHYLEFIVSWIFFFFAKRCRNRMLCD